MLPLRDEQDRNLVSAWRPDAALTDVLGDYDYCDLFARYVLENGGGLGRHHAVLFGHHFLTTMRGLGESAERDRQLRLYLAGGEFAVDCLEPVEPRADRHVTDEAIMSMYVLVANDLLPAFQRFRVEMSTFSR